MLALQATARNLRPLLVECNDFGGQTSFNSLRIIHGGLRYLQSFDLPRFFESVRERRWFLSVFPDFVTPLTCLMPLYGSGLKRNSILRVALAVNDALSVTRNSGVSEEARLPRGRVIDGHETRRLFPMVGTDGLRGAALWHDAAIVDSPRVIMELLHWAAAYGADLLNYVEAEKLVRASGRVTGLICLDRVSGERHVFEAPVVVNSTGPWSGRTATTLGSGGGPSFYPSLAWNLWMDSEALSESALAITPQQHHATTYFLHPWKGRLLIGTGHAPWLGSLQDPKPSNDQIKSMLDDINSAIPGLELVPAMVRHIFSGLLPARGDGSAELSVRPQFTDHGKAGGPRGLYSVFGIKFTTSRHVAMKTLDRIFGKYRGKKGKYDRPEARIGWCFDALDVADEDARKTALAALQALIADEAVVHLSDLVLRRTDLWENPPAVSVLAPEICKLFSWDEKRRILEFDMLDRELCRCA